MSLGKLRRQGATPNELRKGQAAASDRNGYDCQECNLYNFLVSGADVPAAWVQLSADHIRRDHEPACS